MNTTALMYITSDPTMRSMRANVCGLIPNTMRALAKVLTITGG